MIGVEKILTQEEYTAALEGETDLEKKVELDALNELAYEDLILAINTSSSVGKVMFGLVCKAACSTYCLILIEVEK